jgi:hypothetical protein
LLDEIAMIGAQVLAKNLDSSNPLIRAAAERLLAYRPLAENAKGRAGFAVGEDETHEQDGELPWVEESKER